ncbi:MAG: hypothetical protein R3F30_12830 [Planctomycetota bacterium]
MTSASRTECPPTSMTPASSSFSWPPRRTSASTVVGRLCGQPTIPNAVNGFAPIA